MNSLVERHLRAFATEALQAFPVLVIEGARQVGKSTFAGMLVSGRTSLSLTLDDRTLLDAARQDPQGFVEQAGERVLVIDEVQRAPDLILAVKLSVDRHRAPGRFILTGSSDLLALERTPDSLAGRAVTLALAPLSQGELAGSLDDLVPRLIHEDPLPTTKPWTRAQYVAAVVRGGYPEVRLLDARMRRTWIDSYIRRIVQRDATEVLATPQPQRLTSLLRLIAANQSGELVKARLATAAALPASSITPYLDALRTLFLITMIEPWTPNLTRREVGRPKAVVTDSGVAARLAGLTEEGLGQPTGNDHLGPLLEGFVAAELTRQQGWSAEEFRVGHFRDRNGLEVDLIIELGDGRVIGIEVKAAQTLRAQDFRGLGGLRDRLGDRFVRGVVLYTGYRSVPFGDRLSGLPVCALWEPPS